MKPLSVLIVEDEPVMRALLRDFLQSRLADIAVREAANGARALALAGEQCPDVVLMDIALPDANGIVLTARIRELCPQTRVIMVTGMSGSAYLERAFDVGAFAYVTKDAIFADLIGTVARALAEVPRPGIADGTA